jgi:hypothetical protein
MRICTNLLHIYSHVSLALEHSDTQSKYPFVFARKENTQGKSFFSSQVKDSLSHDFYKWNTVVSHFTPGNNSFTLDPLKTGQIDSKVNIEETKKLVTS